MFLTTIIRGNQKYGHIIDVTKVNTPLDIHTKTLSYGMKAAVANFNFCLILDHSGRWTLSGKKINKELKKIMSIFFLFNCDKIILIQDQ